MKHHCIILFSLIACLLSCQAPKKKVAMRIANLALYEFYTNENNADSINQALHLLDSSIRLYPDPTFYLYKYQIYRSTNRQLDALNTCDTILEIDSKNYFATLSKGYVFEAMGRLDSANRYYRAALNILGHLDSLKVPTMLKDHETIVIAALLKDTPAFNGQVSAFQVKYRKEKGDLFESYIDEFKHFRRDDYVQHGEYVHRDTANAIEGPKQ